MRFLIICCVLLLIISCSPAKRSFHNATIITHVNTIDAVEGLMHDRSVIIVDEKIAAIEASNNFNLTGESIIIDGKDKYLIPGLWDAHVHFAYIEELAPAMFDLFLSYGVTSVRDTGGRTAFVKKWRDAANADPYRSPRVKIAGPLIDGMPNVYDGSDPTHPPLSLGSATVEEASALVDQLADEDVDLLKAYEMLSPEQFMAIARRAKDKGLKLTGHATQYGCH